MKVAFAIIVKATADEAPHLDRCLNSFSDHVDGVFLTLTHKPLEKVADEIYEVIGKYENVFTNEIEWKNDFSYARNHSFAQVPQDYDFIGWVDCDDVIVNPEKIKAVCEVTPDHVDGIFINYHYQMDDLGNVLVEHWVNRIVRNNGAFVWKGRIHETLIEQRRAGKVMNEEFWIDHLSDDGRRDDSLQRNITLLEQALETEDDQIDPRTIYYLATHYIDAGRIQEAEEHLQTYLKLSGWPEERAQAWTWLSKILVAKNNNPEAVKCLLNAINENPSDPAPYIEMGEIELTQKRYDRAVEWLKMGLNKEKSPLAIVTAPMETTYKAFMLLSEAYLQIGGKKLPDALKWVQEAYRKRPDEDTKAQLKKIEHITDLMNRVEHVMHTVRELPEEERLDFVNKLPQELQENPQILRVRKRYTTPKKWDKSVVIFCGNSVLGNWGPWSLKEGIGGSEEAVIRLSKHLKDLGYDVHVYGTPGHRHGKYDGVQWKNYWELDTRDEFDVFIAWRSPWFFDVDIKARKRYLWLHDVMEQEEFTEKRLNNLDKVMVLSEYHRTLFPNIPDDKIFLTGNGIDETDFEKVDGEFERDPHRIVYMSSHVRGLSMLYDIWDDVRKEVPDAKLDIYYGWGSFDNVNRNNPERMQWKDKMVAQANELEGVTDHGKVSQEQIVEEIAKSGVWAYPCPFPEIYCITAIKAQAGGAVPVSSNFAALDETVQFGTKIKMKAMSEKVQAGNWDKEDLDKFKKELISMLKNTDKQEEIRPKMMKWARSVPTWKSVAEEWDNEFAS